MTGNKKISQLVELTAGQVSPDDWLVIVDIQSKESKKIKASELGDWLNESGSLHAIHADLADTSSWAYNLVGGVTNALTAISASWASASISSSFATTAAYAASGGSGGIVPGSYYAILVSWASSSVSASWASSSLRSTFTDTASFLQYIPGGNNGTASYAITSQNVTSISASWASSSLSTSYSPNSNSSSVSISSSHAVDADTAFMSDTASYLYYDGSTPNGTASYALSGLPTENVSHSIFADTASYFNNIGDIPSIKSSSWSQQSGRAISSSNSDYASYAISAGSVLGSMNLYGIYPAMDQDISGSIIEILNVNASWNSFCSTMIDICGNATLYFTSSVTNYPSISLYILDRQRGYLINGDNTTIAFNTTGTLETGSFSTSFRLITQQQLYGEYYLYITCSNPSLQLDINRTINFSFASYSDNLSIGSQTESPLSLYISPISAYSTFYVTGGLGPYIDTISGLMITGSQNISSLDISNQNITDVKYTFYLSTMSYFDCSNNLTLTSLDYSFPNTLNTLYCQSCSLNSIYNLSNTNLQTFVCSYNNLSLLPNMPSTVNYLDCSSNPLSLESSFNPSLLTTLICNDTNISTVNSIPLSIVTASFSGSSISIFSAPMPNTLQSLNLGNNPITSLSIMGVSCSYVNVASSLLTLTSLQNMTQQLINNAQPNGILDIRGTGIVTDFILQSNILALQSNGWTVLRDL